jgi:hypothetical protein
MVKCHDSLQENDVLSMVGVREGLRGYKGLNDGEEGVLHGSGRIKMTSVAD